MSEAEEDAMGLAVDKVGERYEAPAEMVDGDRAMAYAAATNDHNPAYASGRVPPVFGVVPAWSAMASAVADLVPPELFPMLVHGEQDMHLLQPLTAGLSLLSTSEVHSVRVGRSGTRATILVRSTDADSGRPLLDQFVTMIVRGMTDGADAGPDRPDHTFPEGARAARIAERTLHVDDDQTVRYADASGDHNPIHLDDGFARSVGLPGRILHGLCTMAMASQAVVSTVAGGDPGRLRRLAVRFAKTVSPGSDLVVTVYEMDGGGAGDRRHYAFEAHSEGQLVLAHGRAEIEA